MAKSKVPPPPDLVPEHIVLIPDGNGRWATAHGCPTAEGHRKGAEAVESFLKVCRDWQVSIATIWGFSTENWSRSRIEVDAIMGLVEMLLRRNRKGFKRDGLRFCHLGRKDRIAGRYRRLGSLLAELEAETAGCKVFTLNLALDYGGRDEVVRAVRRLLAEGSFPDELVWEDLEKKLDTAGQVDPALVIRSSGEQRLSGILPLQSAYAEMVFMDRLLPDLGEDDFRQAIREFAHRERRFGGRPQEPEASERGDAT